MTFFIKWHYVFICILKVVCYPGKISKNISSGCKGITNKENNGNSGNNTVLSYIIHSVGVFFQYHFQTVTFSSPCPTTDDIVDSLLYDIFFSSFLKFPLWKWQKLNEWSLQKKQSKANRKILNFISTKLCDYSS